MTDHFFELLDHVWPLFAAMGMLVAWGFKLEFASRNHAKILERHELQISDLKTKQDEEIKALTREISLVRESLARIEGALGLRRQVSE